MHTVDIDCHCGVFATASLHQYSPNSTSGHQLDSRIGQTRRGCNIRPVCMACSLAPFSPLSPTWQIPHRRSKLAVSVKYRRALSPATSLSAVGSIVASDTGKIVAWNDGGASGTGDRVMAS